MNKYVLQVLVGQNNTAGQKAKKDIANILSNKGFETIDIRLRKSKIMKLLFSAHEVKKQFKRIDSDDVFVMQYPMYSRLTTRIISKVTKKRKINTICIIHDLESLRLFKNDSRKVNEELRVLNDFDCLVSHNDVMTKWLKENGVTTQIVSLNVFDYLSNTRLVNVKKNDSLVFAGNLQKSKFLEKWDIKKDIRLFGIGASESYSKYVTYEGVKDPDELPKYLDGSFGLVWDGDSMITNDGIYGDYTRYNNPHKVSLYLSSGLPVIVWRESAISKFIEENNLGIVVSSLYELEKILNDMTDEEYVEMKNEVKNISLKLRHGCFTSEAIGKAFKLLNID
ncbi:hypothetical protein GBP19_08515 [Pediococcus acidilactici]|uniref:sugar transferase n=1 Tax=Pediococcus acidilactici TaxID=1254 RepID=UPI0013267A09|nr:sugar transferase [Pediococcus acidilactici]KAF0333408.1 hypothetical protein GBO38_07710 [Pediococcus acidilactici]KAF0347273.1 hypothetical protein GBO44_06105 [Pediococcus acidilactici]KAF0392760.1 hypothetical protein GBO68_07700 [Pediococcus acidilactici]KAF0396098.1 hypothetical protein GBO72_08215 [Pediococcus acidilactici]KAF0408653.1 hypothetical protein GBO78_07715 [Pediococcus acidilactici]